MLCRLSLVICTWSYWPKRLRRLNESMYRLVLICCLLISGAVANSAAAQLATQVNRLNQLLEEAWQARGITPADSCSDEQFLRRISLDLLGRIPSLAERDQFLEHRDRQQWIDRLLSSEEFPRFWAEQWTAQLYGYAGDEADRETLEQWLQEQLRDQVPYDRVATALISATGESAFTGPVNFLLRYPEEPVIKVTRAFLGVRLDCARCHDHPFDRWTEEDYTRMSRFFDTIQREDLSGGNVRLFDVPREVELEDRPRFLTGAQPRTSQWRAELALFLTRSRPFARNVANRTWYQLLGRGIVHPVDDVQRENPAVLPEVLEWLADEALISRFDVRHLIRLICNSRAYQVDSRLPEQGGPGSAAQQLFAVRPLKPLTPEQWYRSMCVAADLPFDSRQQKEFLQQFLGDGLDGDFSAIWDYRETAQGVMSRLVSSVAPPAGSLDELTVRLLNRHPTDSERQLLGTVNRREAWFVLLHSQEFAFNH